MITVISQELLGNSELLTTTHQEVENLSKSIIAFLGQVSESRSVQTALQAKLDHVAAQFKR